MSMRGWIVPASAAVLLVPLAFVTVREVARGLQLAVLCAGLAPAGAVLLLAIARLTGATWDPLDRIARPLVAVVPLTALAMLAGGGWPLPPHLAVWQHPLFAAARAVVASGALAFAGTRLARGASEGFAGATLALYAACVTPVAMDWLMAPVPGHAVSAAGMMLFVEQIAAACALLLVSATGDRPLRRDLSRLMIAAALGLCYIAFMDYLITWFGNLPARVGFYIARGGPAVALAGAASIAGLAAPVAALALLPQARGERAAGAGVLTGLFLFDLWWLGGGIVAGLVAAGVLMLVAPLMLAAARWRRPAHG